MTFFEDWFGIHAGRETFKDHNRQFIETPEELAFYVQYCLETKQPAYMSVQPFSARDQPFGLEKLFFDLDSKEDPSKAWNEAKAFSQSLIKYYEVQPFIKFSGRKGFHVDIFLNRVVQFPTYRLEFIKTIYEKLQTKILAGLKFETLDQGVIGDVKRLERVPFSVHEATGDLCLPVDLEGNPIPVKTLNPYRERGLDTKIIESICKEIKSEEKRREVISSRHHYSNKINSNVRPCIEKALSLPLHGGEGHKMRLAVAAEYLNKGASRDQVVDLFRAQTDFGNGEKCRYFVEDAKRKGYKPFKCSTIRELGFCLDDSCSLHKKGRRRLERLQDEGASPSAVGCVVENSSATVKTPITTPTALTLGNILAWLRLEFQQGNNPILEGPKPMEPIDWGKCQLCQQFGNLTHQVQFVNGERIDGLCLVCCRKINDVIEEFRAKIEGEATS